MDCRKLVRQAFKRWRQFNKTRSDKKVGNIRAKFARFARDAQPDLEFLCAKGANPFALIRLIDTHLWWWGGADMELNRKFDTERRSLSSHPYWRDCTRALAKTERQLRQLKQNMWAQILARMNPDIDDSGLIKLVARAFEAHSAVEGVLHDIRELGLNQSGWELREGAESGVLELRRGGRVGKEMSGRARGGDWAACAGVLHIYLKMTTGKPHWVSVVRLLQYAGVDSFTAILPREGTRRKKDPKSKQPDLKVIYTDTVRKRIGGLRRDPIIWHRLEARARQHIVWFGKDGVILSLEE